MSENERESSVREYIDAHYERTVAELFEFLRIGSVSTDPERRADVDAAAAWVAEQLRAAGPLTVEIIQTAGHPVVYAEWLGAPDRPTVLVYGHYDVQPPDPIELWQSPPFLPEIRDGRIYARGASDDKGSMFIPIKVAEAFFETSGALPINIKMLFEGEEEIGSPSLSQFVVENADMLRADFALSADGAMWQPDAPSITTGSRGLAALNIDVVGPAKDLHSGRHGGSLQNPLHALAELIASLHHPDGSVAVNGFYDEVVELPDDERERIAALPFDDEEYRHEIGVSELFGEPGYSTLERQWSRPTVEVNGIVGGYGGEGLKTVIPATAHAKISCRLVPNQDPEDILVLLERHLREHLPPGVAIHITRTPGRAPAYRIPSEHRGLQVARQVLTEQYGVPPTEVLIGGTLPVSDIFFRVLGIDTVYFSFSTADEDFHAPNEFFRAIRFRDGLHAWASYWLQTSELPGIEGT